MGYDIQGAAGIRRVKDVCLWEICVVTKCEVGQTRSHKKWTTHPPSKASSEDSWFLFLKVKATQVLLDDGFSSKYRHLILCRRNQKQDSPVSISFCSSKFDQGSASLYSRRSTKSWRFWLPKEDLAFIGDGIPYTRSTT